MSKQALYKEVLDRMGRGEDPAAVDGAVPGPEASLGDAMVANGAEGEAPIAAVQPAKAKGAKAKK